MDNPKKKTGIRRLKNETSRIVDEVCESGSNYVITKRGRPVAVIRPWDERDELEERHARAAEIVAALDRMASRVAKAAGRRSAVAAVREQRR